jgi:hypothetical protein
VKKFTKSVSFVLLLQNFGRSNLYQIPVALAMWNQVGSECEPSSTSRWFSLLQFPRIHSAVLLIRTYAFFNRNIYVLWFLISAISGVVAYQLYVDTTQMLCKFHEKLRCSRIDARLNKVLPFARPPFVTPLSIPAYTTNQ